MSFWRVSVATKYAWTCSRIINKAEVIKGSVKLVMLAIAALVPEHHASTGLVRLSTLVKMTGLEERQVRRCRDFLAKLREIDVETVGKRARYVMVGMAGPLFVAAAAEDADRMSGFFRDIERWEAGHPVRIRFDPDKLSASGTSLDRRTAFRTGVLSTKTRINNNHHQPTPVERIADVHQLYDWWVPAFVLHTGGPTSVVVEVFAPVALELLNTFTIEQIQAMALVMWAVKDVRVHNWIPTTDYSIKVLQQTTDWLSQRVRQTDGPVVPDVTESWSEICDVLRRHYASVQDVETFDRWIAPLTPSSVREVFTIWAPSREHRDAIPADVETWIAFAVRQVCSRRHQFMWPPSSEKSRASAGPPGATSIR